MKRRNLIFLVFMLVVGFAAITSAVVISGGINLSFDESDFEKYIVFNKAESNDGTATINSNGKNITFESKKLEFADDTAVLDFGIINKSRTYDASVTINCGLKNNFSSFDEYLSFTTNLTNPIELTAGSSTTGKLTIKLKKIYTEEASPEIQCTLVVNPESRSEYNTLYSGELYKDPVLNGADPVLDGEKLVPVKIDNDGTVSVADTDEEWYNYEAKEWANAVILVDSPTKAYNIGNIIPESDIESYFVWIPRYRYQIFDEGNYKEAYPSTAYEDQSGIHQAVSKPTESIAKEIQIVFENKNTATSNGTTVGSWLTHPAFTNYDTNGIWVGKFETGYSGATSVSTSAVNTNDATKVIIKPNVYSWRNITVSNIFKTSLAYESSMKSHMMRNTEWGAVAYLSHSKYGINGQVKSTSSQYNTEAGYSSSTTGNITGIYAISGGLLEYVAANSGNNSDQSDFTTDELTKITEHLDRYPAVNTSDSSLITAAYNYRILGDATGEMGPFYMNSWWTPTNNWYNGESEFFSEDSWLVRGGSDQFSFEERDGRELYDCTFRITLVPDN